MSHDASCDARGCCAFITIWIQTHGSNRFPIADGPTPAFGRAATRAEIHGAPREEPRGITPRMPVVRRDESNRAVQVLCVVPAHEGLDPRACRDAIRKRVRRIGGTIFQGAE